MAGKYKSIALALATALTAAPVMMKQVMAQQIGTATAVNPSHQGAVTVETPAAVIGIRVVSQGANGTQDFNLNGKHSIQNGAGTTNTITGFMVNIPNWNTPPGPPFPIPPDLALHNITILSSKFGQ